MSTIRFLTRTSIKPQFRTIDGLRIRYADSGGSHEPTLLLTSPWPESLYAFAPMWATLAEHARLFAIDLPGFGASERRDDLLSPRAMGGFLARLIAEADLGRPHIVAPDVGTSAALFAAADTSRADRERDRRHRRGRGSARARRAAAVVGARPRPRQVPPDGPARDRRRGAGHDRGRRARRDPRRLPRLLRRRPLRRVDALRPQVSRGAARARRAAAADRDAGHDHQRPPRPRRAASPTPSSSTSGCPTAASRSSTPATSSGKRRRRSTPRSSSTRSTERRDERPRPRTTSHDTRRDAARRGRGDRVRLPPLRPPGRAAARDAAALPRQPGQLGPGADRRARRRARGHPGRLPGRRLLDRRAEPARSPRRRAR